MKVFKDNKVYVQLKDLKYMFENGGIAIPQSIYKKALKRSLDMTASDKNEFIMFDDISDVEFFKTVPFIIDLDEVKNMTDEEYNNFMLSSQTKLIVYKTKAESTKKYFELLNLRNKYKNECHKIIDVKEARRIKPSKIKLNKTKKRRLFNFGRRNG